LHTDLNIFSPLAASPAAQALPAQTRAAPSTVAFTKVFIVRLLPNSLLFAGSMSGRLFQSEIHLKLNSAFWGLEHVFLEKSRRQVPCTRFLGLDAK
jgi:hypothetical protein